MMSVLGSYKRVNEFLGDLSKAVKDTPWPEALAEAVPWTGLIGEAVADSVAPVKFVYSLYDKATEVTDANEIAQRACTVAFERSVEVVLKRHENWLPSDRKKWTPTPQAEAYDFMRFSLATARQHPFFTDANQLFQDFCDVSLGLEGHFTAVLSNEVRREFVKQLRLILSQRKTGEKFESLRRLLEMEDPDDHLAAIDRHIEYQCWLYEQKHVLNIEPFALKDIYVDMDCGALTWKEITERSKTDKTISFTDESPENGGRTPLLETVLGLLADPEFDDSIVIQGGPGAGKSSFTLKLCSVLAEYGLKPIRIELKHVALDSGSDVMESLAKAVLISDSEFNTDPNAVHDYPSGIFDQNEIFSRDAQKFTYPSDGGDEESATICPYVVILDAWDEISLAENPQLIENLTRLLSTVRNELLKRNSKQNFRVRVILTGRPNDVITKQSKFPTQKTRFLTMRPFTKEQLAKFANTLSAKQAAPPLMLKETGQSWQLRSPERIQQTLDLYEKSLDQERQSQSNETVEILGMPLLALLAFRVIAQSEHPPEELFRNAAMLYRHLVESLLSGGKLDSTADETVASAHLRGERLRQTLWATAEFITVLGEESLSQKEWMRRLTLKFSDEEREVLLEELNDTEAYTRLMVSFFFRPTGQEGACEFTHKSFREYLYAESLVELLKSLADTDASALPKELLHSLGSQWMTREIVQHFESLIEWEISRADKEHAATETMPLSLEKWAEVKRRLDEYWVQWRNADWLRSRIARSDDGEYKLTTPFVVEIANRTRTLTQPLRKDDIAVSVHEIDAHLGNALMFVCGIVSAALFRVDQDGRAREHAVGRFQPFIPGESPNLVVPRIQSASGRPHIRLRLTVANLRWTDLSKADLSKADLSNADLRKANLRQADLSGANLSGANLSGANLSRANLSRADLRRANLIAADLGEADLCWANLSWADLNGANLRWADLNGANLREADLGEADLSRADLSGADLRWANLSEADLNGAHLNGADLNGADLRGATIDSGALSKTRGKPRFLPDGSTPAD